MTTEELEPLPPELARLLDAERPLTVAPAAARARLFARLAGELFPGGGSPSGGEHGGQGGGSGGAPPTGGAAGGAGAAGAGGWTAAAATKLAVGVGVVTFTVGGLVGAGVQSLRTPVTPPAARQPVDAQQEPAAVKAAPPAVVPRGSDASLQEENSLIETARAALARKDAAAALTALAAHEAKFPSGQLVEERCALEVLALATLGRNDDARAKASAFRQRFPAGLFRGLVDGAAPP